MSSNVNKPTTYGYHSNMQRSCVTCGHVELKHYGKRCYVGIDGGGHMDDDIITCQCTGYTNRELTDDEREILAELVERELTYVGEALELEIRRESERRK